MKLILHEFKYLLLHYRWLLLIWWLIGAGMLFASGGLVDLIVILYWSGLLLIPVLLLQEISPHRAGNNSKGKPMLQRQSIAARFIFLVVGIGLPLWIFETVFLIGVAEKGGGFTVAAIAEKAFLFILLWGAFGLLGWFSNRYIQGVVAVVVIAVLILGFAYLPQSWEESVDKWLFWTESKRTYLNKWGELYALVISLVPISGWLLGWVLRNRQPSAPWLGLLIGAVASNFGGLAFQSVYAKTALLFSTQKDELKEVVANTQFDLGSLPNSWQASMPYYRNLHSPKGYQWLFRPEFDGLPSDVSAKPVSVAGQWGWLDPSKETVLFRGRRNEIGNFYQMNQWLFYTQAKALESSVYLTAEQKPLLYAFASMMTEFATIYSDPGRMPQYFPENVSVQGEFEYERTTPWHEVTHEWQKNPYLGKARLLSRKEDIVLEAFRSNRQLDLANGVIPKLYLGFWNERLNEWWILDRHWSYEVQAPLSSAPRVRITVQLNYSPSISFQNQGDSIKTAVRKRILESRMFICSSEYIGRHQFNIAQRNQDPVTKIPQPGKLHSQKRTVFDRKLTPDNSRWEHAPKGDEQELRKWLYEFSIAKTGLGSNGSNGSNDSLLVESFPNEHRLALYQAIEVTPHLTPYFSNIWQRELDLDWMYNQVVNEPSQSMGNDFAHVIADKGWLKNDRQKAVALIDKVFFSNPSHSTQSITPPIPLLGATFGRFHPEKSSLYLLAKDLEIPKFETQAKTYAFQTALDLELQSCNRDIPLTKKAEYPEVWDSALKATIHYHPEENRLPAYRSGYPSWIFATKNSRLTGTEEPLRTAVELIARGALKEERLEFMAVPLHMPSGQPSREPVMFREPWVYFCRLFNQPSELEAIPADKRADVASEWLQEKWEYIPETLSFKFK